MCKQSEHNSSPKRERHIAALHLSVHPVCQSVMLCVQGEVKPALARLRESRAARARELSEELLSVQERLDAGLEALTERTEENATLGTQVRSTRNVSSPTECKSGHLVEKHSQGLNVQRLVSTCAECYTSHLREQSRKSCTHPNNRMSCAAGLTKTCAECKTQLVFCASLLSAQAAASR